MRQPRLSARGVRILFAGLIIGLLSVSMALASVNQAPGEPLQRGDFFSVAPQGFGDRQNSWAWSMQWWNGRLYVGTNRAWHCAEIAALANLLPGKVTYPPEEPEVECTPDPEDLPLQAEIWRWLPETNSWERVYQSPADVQLSSGKMVARDVGYRGMTVFTEPDGTEALYVTTVSPQFIFPDLTNVPARILRSTDGVHFEPVPQDPGTALGNFPFSVFRNPIEFNGRFYVTGGTVQGSGVLLESDNPALGNDHFRIVSPPGMIVSALSVFNDQLYVGTRSIGEGYGVYRTSAQGEPPYEFIPVVEKGGYLLSSRNPEVLSMQEFNGYLYVGGNGIAVGSLGPGAAAELIRVAKDDSWDLIVGYPRLTPDGFKYPLSGLMAGFGNLFNAHMWRMAVHDGNLYVGTFDTSTTLRNDPKVGPLARQFMGFDLYVTTDGLHFTPVSTNGFEDPYNFGVRTLASTPYGLFLGTANYYYGLQIWLGTKEIVTPTPTATATLTPTPQPITVTIPTRRDWNLISVGVQPVSPRVEDVLREIWDRFKVLLSFEQGGLTFRPDLPDFNTLEEFDYEHGYWLFTLDDEPLDLVVHGYPVAPDSPIHLEQGWNLVSFLLPVPMPVEQALASIDGKYTVVLGFDEGAMSYYTTLPPQLSTLTVMQPHMGYWIYMTEPGVLRYPNIAEPSMRSQESWLRTAAELPHRSFLPAVSGGPALNRPQVSPDVRSTNEWINVYSMNSTYNGQPLPVGAVVTAVGEDGRKLGEVRVTVPGWYGLLAVYRDDQYTEALDGARQGESIRFLINGQPATITNGVNPTWTGNGDLFEVDLEAWGP
ncbi:MAG: hypothetical protein Kow0047_03290 [Anaerolineae bacterium]